MHSGVRGTVVEGVPDVEPLFLVFRGSAAHTVVGHAQLKGVPAHQGRQPARNVELAGACTIFRPLNRERPVAHLCSWTRAAIPAARSWQIERLAIPQRYLSGNAVVSVVDDNVLGVAFVRINANSVIGNA